MWKKEKRFNFAACVVLMSILAISVVSFGEHLLLDAAYSWVNGELNEEEKFRANEISDGCLSFLAKENVSGKKAAELITRIYFYEGTKNTVVTEEKAIQNMEQEKCVRVIEEKYKEEYEALFNSNQAIWADVKYFPVPLSLHEEKATVSYENSWKFERTFGGKRYHEGCDIMADINKRGLYPVISMTDGIVEKKGWLPKGGYRIGIRGNSGAYFYYAHLESYADIEEGDKIKAGELLGFMGDSGYGEEGTTGKFDVHLHVGIYIKTKNHEELSINPYPVLKYLEHHTLTMDFGKN